MAVSIASFSLTHQIQVVEKPGQHSYLKYTEDISKNRPGGLKGRKLKPKVVHHYNNPENPERCFVQLFKLYQQLPTNRTRNIFYFQPLKKPCSDQWFSNKPIGHNTQKVKRKSFQTFSTQNLNAGTTIRSVHSSHTC